MESAPDSAGTAAAGSVGQSDAEFGARLKAARDKRQLSQTAVATRSKWADPEGKGISRTALIGYEAGTSRPGTRELRILCATLVVSPNQLLFGSEAPLQTAHVALEGLSESSGRGLRQAVELAFVLVSLKGHEREALMSLALSLAGRQLGDVRLSGLRSLAALAEPEIAAVVLPKGGGREDDEPLDAIVERLSHQQGSNFGTNLLFAADGKTPIGAPLYPDPDTSVTAKGRKSK